MKKHLALATLTLLALSACAPKDPPLVAPTVAPNSVDQSAPLSQSVMLAPKVDILFVVDNSDSMEPKQQSVKDNIDRFAAVFDKAENIDFHIGVVSIFDSKRFGPVVKTFYPLGILQPLKDPAHPGEAVAGPQYITRAPGYVDVLADSVYIGVIPRGTTKHDLGGPEFEETFSPVVAAIDGRNPGFIRQDAHLAVIMVTDANDDSTITARELAYDLVQAKGGDMTMISTFAALALDGCPMDPSGPPTKILDYLKRTNGHAYNLCDPHFGDRMAEAAQIIAKQAAEHQKIYLSAIPEAETLNVSIGGVALPQSPTNGWTYDMDAGAIVINGDLNAPAGQMVQINYIQVDPRKMVNGHAHQVGG